MKTVKCVLDLKLPRMDLSHLSDPASESAASVVDLPTFVSHVLHSHREDNFLVVKHGNYRVTEEEAPAEIVDWTMQYLKYM